jgi:hypothetical protein
MTFLQRLLAVNDALDAVTAQPEYQLLRANGAAWNEVQRDLTRSLARGPHVWVLNPHSTVIAPAGIHPYYARRIERAARSM